MEASIKSDECTVVSTLTPAEFERLRPTIEKATQEKLDRVMANHAPGYWEKVLKAIERLEGNHKQ